MYEEALVAVGQAEDAAAPGNHAFEPAGAGVGAVKNEAEIAGMGGLAVGCVAPAWGQARVGMQQE